MLSLINKYALTDFWSNYLKMKKNIYVIVIFTSKEFCRVVQEMGLLLTDLQHRGISEQYHTYGLVYCKSKSVLSTLKRGLERGTWWYYIQTLGSEINFGKKLGGYYVFYKNLGIDKATDSKVDVIGEALGQGLCGGFLC